MRKHGDIDNNQGNPAVAKTEKELRDEFERYSDRENWSAWLIVVALLMEAYAAWYFSTPDKAWYETTFLIAANLAIAAGVYGEIRFGRKADTVGEALQQISDEKIAASEARAAEANQKALEATLELAKFRSPRILTPEQVERAVERLKQFSGTEYDAAINTNDPELRACLASIDLMLAKAGWKSLTWAAPIPVVHRHPNGPYVGVGFAVSNLVVGMHRDNMRELRPAAHCLANELKAVGIEASAEWLVLDPTISANKTAIHIMIGRKM